MSHIRSLIWGLLKENTFKGILIDNTFKGILIDNISRIERKRYNGNFIDNTFKGEEFLLIIPLKMCNIPHPGHWIPIQFI